MALSALINSILDVDIVNFIKKHLIDAMQAIVFHLLLGWERVFFKGTKVMTVLESGLYFLYDFCMK